MEVQIISDTIQKFEGKSYYFCGFYFQRKGVRLHRAVWEKHNGEIPKGYHVHHKDENRKNNEIENLELLPAGEHMSVHMSKEERREESRRHIEIAREAANKWHGSKAGREWHSKHGADIWKDKPYYTQVCDWCGEEYQTRDIVHKTGQHFCCGKHRSLATQWRYKHEGSTDYPRRKK